MAAPLSISKPFKPFNITQHWGNPNSVYAGQFNDPNFKRHNGVDANVGNLIPDGSKGVTFLVYCPVDGFVVDKVQYRPDGGGNEVWFISKEPLQIGDREAYAYMVMCHAHKVLVKAGDELKKGQLVMIADSTGFSTGPHTHIGLYRVGKNGASWIYYDQNDATGSYNPELFLTDKYAVDEASLGTLISNNLLYFKYLSGLV